MRAIGWSPIVAGLLLLLLGVFSAVGPSLPATASAEQDACPPNPSPPNPADPSVIVNTPVAGQRVTSPVSISGRARVFEAVVSISIFDATGTEIVRTSTMASEFGPVPAPFSTSVPFVVAKEQAGCIRVFESSAKDGSPINVVQIPVTLTTKLTPPSTGDGALAADRASDQGLPPPALAAGVCLLLLGLPVIRRVALKHRK
jgi:hypothetical protein